MSEEANKPISPLRQRMIEDMCMRRLSPKTQTQYIRAVKRLARFLGRSPDAVSGDDLRRFQLHLVQVGTSPITINATIIGVLVDGGYTGYMSSEWEGHAYTDAVSGWDMVAGQHALFRRLLSERAS